ncbi:hypothetical protein BD410DRAFT_803599 [Rickenella mellea]|uniref:Uncharacterized protein n=1 Tax=Rickenella mellea TaxID=50990 RepID=A0A4Y7Q494_9AGAM|nr:hypothetical protein BD410DRAFT_803599 [Rickenella mellea]
MEHKYEERRMRKDCNHWKLLTVEAFLMSVYLMSPTILSWVMEALNRKSRSNDVREITGMIWFTVESSRERQLSKNLNPRKLTRAMENPTTSDYGHGQGIGNNVTGFAQAYSASSLGSSRRVGSAA